MQSLPVNRSDPAAAATRLIEACRCHGLPVTVQRREVFAALVPRTDHPTADEIYEQVRVRLAGISRATVYRVLETLVRVGVARKVPHPGTAARFDSVVDRHHHFCCLVCGRLSDLNLPELDQLPVPSSRAGVRIEDYSVYFTGTCELCVQPRPKSTRKPASAVRPNGAPRRR